MSGHEPLTGLVHYVPILLSAVDHGSIVFALGKNKNISAPSTADRKLRKWLTKLKTHPFANGCVFSLLWWTREDSNSLPPQCK